MTHTDDSDAKLGMVLVTLILEQAVRDGKIEVEGKSKAELEREFQEYAHDFLARLKADEVVLAPFVDLTSLALEQAREFVREGKLEFACVFYAMWIEHWINDLIGSFATRLGLGQDTREQVIRETSLRGKFTWVMRIFDLPEIDPAQLRNITKITDIRNSYVHFKFKPVIVVDKEKETLQEIVEAAEQVVQYLQKYMSDNVFGNADEIISQMKSRFFDE